MQRHRRRDRGSAAICRACTSVTTGAAPRKATEPQRRDSANRRRTRPAATPRSASVARHRRARDSTDSTVTVTGSTDDPRTERVEELADQAREDNPDPTTRRETFELGLM